MSGCRLVSILGGACRCHSHWLIALSERLITVVRHGPFTVSILGAHVSCLCAWILFAGARALGGRIGWRSARNCSGGGASCRRPTGTRRDRLVPAGLRRLVSEISGADRTISSHAFIGHRAPPLARQVFNRTDLPVGQPNAGSARRPRFAFFDKIVDILDIEVAFSRV